MIGKRSGWKAESGAETTPAVPSCYISASPLPDIWHEQLNILASHASHNAPACPDCQRLAQVVRILMRPFE